MIEVEVCGWKWCSCARIPKPLFSGCFFETAVSPYEIHTIHHQPSFFFLELLKTPRIGLLQKKVGWQVKCALLRLNRLLKTDGEWNPIYDTLFPSAKQTWLSRSACYMYEGGEKIPPKRMHDISTWFSCGWGKIWISGEADFCGGRRMYSSPLAKELVSRCSLLNIQGHILSAGAFHDTYHFTT